MPGNLKRRRFRPILKSAELPKDFRLYDLRHSCATLLPAAGEHPQVVSERLGHASIKLTTDVHSHVRPTMRGRPHGSSKACLTTRPAQHLEFGGTLAVHMTKGSPLAALSL